MKYYLVEEEANYCGYDESYLIKSDKEEHEIECFCAEHAYDRTENYADDSYEDDDEEPLHIGYYLEEITKAEFDEKEEYGYDVEIV